MCTLNSELSSNKPPAAPTSNVHITAEARCQLVAIYIPVKKSKSIIKPHFQLAVANLYITATRQRPAIATGPPSEAASGQTTDKNVHAYLSLSV